MRNHYSKFLTFLLVVIWFLSTVTAQAVTLETSISTGEIQLGEEFTLLVTLNYNESEGTIEVESPAFSAFEVSEVIPGEEVIKEGRISRQDTYILTPLTAGTFEIEVPNVILHQNDGTDKTIKTDPRTVVVANIPDWKIDAIDVRDIKGPQSLPQVVLMRPWLKYLLLFTLFVFLLYLYIRYKRPKIEEEIIPEEPPVNAWLEFDESFQRLTSGPLLSTEHMKEFTLQLSLLFRTYLFHRYQFPAQDLTSEEIIHLAATHEKLQPFEERLIHLFDEGDLVKFAEAKLERYQLDDLIKETRDMVIRMEKNEEAVQ